jgi:anion-transporting  ArsA/GET3 family ATPase
VAIAVALAAARGGRRVVLAEVAGQARAASLFDVADADVPGRETPLDRGVWVTTVDPLRALEEWATRVVGSRRLVGVLARSNAFSAFVHAAPGARELITITKAWELGRRARWDRRRRGYDLVVVDGPASGHGLGMLRTPHTFAEIARVGPIASQAREVDELLRDPSRSAILTVALPAELPVSETLDLERRVRDALRRDVDAIVVNGVLPRRFSGEDVAQVAAAPMAPRRPRCWPPCAPTTARRPRSMPSCGACARAPGAAVHTLPLRPVPRLGREDIGELAELLERRLR